MASQSSKSNKNKRSSKPPTVKLGSIRPKVLYWRDRILKISGLGIFIKVTIDIVTTWPVILTASLKAFLWDSFLIALVWYLFMTWMGHRTNRLEFGDEYLVFRGPFTRRFPAKAPYTFSAREWEYRRKGFVSARRYFDESWEVILDHSNGEQIVLATVYQKNRADAMVSHLTAARAFRNQDESYSITDGQDDRPYGDRPKF